MSATGTDLFTCEGCGRSYRWKPEMAGRRVKCKCGQVMTAPASLAPAVAEETEDDDLYALVGETKVKPKKKLMLPEGPERCPVCNLPLVVGAKICVHCGHDLITGKTPPKPTVVDDGTTALKDEPVKSVKPVMKASAVVAPPLAYQSASVKQSTETIIEGTPLKDFYVPIVLIILGTLTEFAAQLWGSSDIASGIQRVAGMVAISMVVNVVTLFAGILVAAKLANMGFGHPLQALLKLGAIAISVPAIQSLGTALTGVGFVGAGISLIAYFALFMWLFELDISEAQIVVGIVWILNILLTFFVMGLILSSIMAG